MLVPSRQRCAPARAGAAARPPGPRLRAALGRGPVGLEGGLSRTKGCPWPMPPPPIALCQPRRPLVSDQLDVPVPLTGLGISGCHALSPTHDRERGSGNRPSQRPTWSEDPATSTALNAATDRTGRCTTSTPSSRRAASGLRASARRYPRDAGGASRDCHDCSRTRSAAPARLSRQVESPTPLRVPPPWK